MNDNEIINKVDLRDKYGTGSDIIEAISRCRSLFLRVGKEWNESNREEKNYFLVKEFERHLMMIHESCIPTEKKNSTSKTKQAVSETSKLSPNSESNNQQREKKMKTNSCDASVPNSKASLDAGVQIQQDQTHRNKWNQRFNDLKNSDKMCDKSRSSNNISSNPSPRMSVGAKRNSYKKSQNADSSILTKNRNQVLNKVGVESEIHRTQSWGKCYKELMSFVREVGHARVPQHFPPNPPLGHWVKRQRYNYKRYQNGDSSDMTEARIHFLSKIGFEWICHKNQNWYRSYEELVGFVEEFGHARVPKRFPQNPSLGSWVGNQRQKYKKSLKGELSSIMSQDRIQLLNKIDFVWECPHSNQKDPFSKLCPDSGEKILKDLLGSDAENKIKDLCEDAYANTDATSLLSDISNKGFEFDNECL